MTSLLLARLVTLGWWGGVVVIFIPPTASATYAPLSHLIYEVRLVVTCGADAWREGEEQILRTDAEGGERGREGMDDDAGRRKGRAGSSGRGGGSGRVSSTLIELTQK